MPKISRQPRSAPRTSGPAKPPEVKPATKEKLKKAFMKLNTAGTIAWGRDVPLGVRFVRVPLLKERGADRYTYTALIPAGALSPNAKPADPNKAKQFFVERSGGLAGVTVYGGPFTVSGKGQAKEPYFSRFLEGQQRQGGVATAKYPSDNEDGGGGSVGGGRPGDNLTLKFPSDSEDGGGGKVDGGVTTAKFPSDNEDGGGGSVGDGGAVTAKFPSDNEDGGAGGGGGISTAKYPSDNEDGGGGGGTGTAVTRKFPSDNDE